MPPEDEEERVGIGRSEAVEEEEVGEDWLKLTLRLRGGNSKGKVVSLSGSAAAVAIASSVDTACTCASVCETGAELPSLPTLNCTDRR